MNNQKGQVLLITIFIIVILSIFIPVLIYFLSQESNWTVKLGESTSALQLAESGISKAIWKLAESEETYNEVSGTMTLAGFNFDKIYSDISGGEYKIKISSGSTEDERIITSVGKSTITEEVRAIKVIVFKTTGIQNSILSPNIDFNGNCYVHWGPIVSTQEIILQGAANNYYPRKFARGKIDPRDTNPDPPNSDYVEYWAYEQIPNPPELDFESYKSSAQATGTYYPSISGITFNNVTDEEEKVYFVEHNCRLKNSFLCGTLIVKGDLTITGGGKGNYDASVPADAYKEYEKVPGYSWPGKPGPPDVTTYLLDKVVFRGFVYVGDDLDVGGTNVIHGAIWVKDNCESNGDFTVYYSTSAAISVDLKERPLQVKSWEEIQITW